MLSGAAMLVDPAAVAPLPARSGNPTADRNSGLALAIPAPEVAAGSATPGAAPAMPPPSNEESHPPPPAAPAAPPAASAPMSGAAAPPVPIVNAANAAILNNEPRSKLMRISLSSALGVLGFGLSHLAVLAKPS